MKRCGYSALAVAVLAVAGVSTLTTWATGADKGATAVKAKPKAAEAVEYSSVPLPDPEKAIAPTRKIDLLADDYQSKMYTWLQDAKYEDPRGVFTVKDGQLHISGDGFGAIITKEDFRDYHLVLEFKWGPRTWQSRKDRTKDSGLLVHSYGPDGNYGNIWMTSIEAQIIEGGTGDFIVVGGKDTDGKPLRVSLTCETAKDRDGETIWKDGGERKTFTRGRINWYGRDPDWKDVKGFRGKEDVESPDGEWTRMDVVCDGGRVIVYVNGVKVNEGFDAVPAAGKLQLQTELAELFVRRWELYPAKNGPKIETAKQ